MTVIAYLSGEEGEGHGGETRFPELGVQVAPRCGRLLVFSSLRPGDDACDARTLHEAMPVTGGPPKRIMQRWYGVEADPLALQRPPPPSAMHGYRPFETHVQCTDELAQLRGRLPTRCREEDPLPDVRPLQGRGARPV